MSPLEGLLRREHLIVAGAIVVLTALAWSYIWQGAGMGMTALEMTKLALFPHRHADMMSGMPMPPMSFATVAAMWWVMMVAMMTPSAAPLLMLHARTLRSRQEAMRHQLPIATLAVLAGYLTVWAVFSLVAAALQFALVHANVISEMMLSSRTPLFSAAVLALAGIYQFAPSKRACLRHCRGPIEFLMRYSRSSPFVLGMRHGAWCVGCCWTLMALLFVVGVMNVAWIAVLTIFVLLEKLSPASQVIRRGSGALLIAWSVATISYAVGT